MKPKSLSQAKNLMRRALKDLVERLPGPAEQHRLRKHFNDCCAYCGKEAGPREGHIDHAGSEGGNSIGNLLLACKTCNGDEKREMLWDKFLEKKCGHDSAIYEQRRQHIIAWMNANPSKPKTLDPAVSAALDEANHAIEAFAKAYNAVRTAISTTTTEG